MVENTLIQAFSAFAHRRVGDLASAMPHASLVFAPAVNVLDGGASVPTIHSVWSGVRAGTVILRFCASFCASLQPDLCEETRRQVQNCSFGAGSSLGGTHRTYVSFAGIFDCDSVASSDDLVAMRFLCAGIIRLLAASPKP